MSVSDLILTGLIGLAAVLYASVGHAGASGYLAAMALFGLAPEVMRPAALVLNILVASLAVYRYGRAGQSDFRLLAPFALAAVPAAFLGGLWTLPPAYYRPLVGAVLLLSAFHFLRTAPGAEKADQAAHRPPLWAALLAGGLLGLLAGLTGTGGGIFLSPLLLAMGWAATRPASGTVAGFILLNSIAGLAGTSFAAADLPPALPLWAGAALGGALLGTHLGTRRLPPPGLRRMLSLVLVIAGLKMIFG